MDVREGTYGQCHVAVAALLLSVPSAAQLAPGVTMPPELGAAYGRLGEAMVQDLLGYRDFRKRITPIDRNPELILVMDYAGPDQGPGAGGQVTRPFTDIWPRRSDA